MNERRHDPVFPGFKEMAQQRRSLAATLSAKSTGARAFADRSGCPHGYVAVGRGPLGIGRGRSQSLSTLERYAAAIGQHLDWKLSLRSLEE